MKDVTIRTKAIPAQPRSKNYPTGATIVRTSEGNATVIPGGNGGSVDIVKTTDIKSLTDKNVLSALRTLLEIRSRIIANGNNETELTDDNVLSSVRTLSEIDSAIQTVLDKIEDLYTIFLRKDQPDASQELITFIKGLVSESMMSAEGGVQFGKSFASGLTGHGGLIDSFGHGELESLVLRRFLEVPELRYNRVSIVSGEEWNAPGGGIIESVDTDNGIIYLKLEPGETAQLDIDDICKASFNNETGFQTTYFRITERVGDSTFKYVLRSGYTFHPCMAMHFVAYGNFTNKDRQKSSYSTQSYVRYLTGVNNWEFTKDMIAMQLGDLSNLKLFGIVMTGHSAYLRNIYMTGVIKQISDDGVTESRVPCFKGEWKSGTYYYYDEVTHNGSTWLCISDKPTMQEPAEGATDWLEKSAKGKDAVSVSIISSNGNIFQKGNVSTTLTTYVTKGDTDITANIPPSRFSWEKESDNKDTDEIFNETHVGHGHVLELTSDDIWGRATFNCIVSL